MFDEVRFTGTVNLGNLINAFVMLVSAIALFYRVRAELAKKEDKTAEAIAEALRKKMLRRRSKKPPPDPDPPL